MSLKNNREQLVKTAVQGAVAPAHQWAPFEVGAAGEIFAWPSTGGITYNVKMHKRFSVVIVRLICV
ncbi:MAG: hypothetical protein Q9M17_10095 [Mariprofundus sp.]|nr:hypothetical protein [Mariprofundus sp.]